MDERTLVRCPNAGLARHRDVRRAALVAMILLAGASLQLANAGPLPTGKPVRLPAVSEAVEPHPITLRAKAAAGAPSVVETTTTGPPDQLFPSLTEEDLPKLPAVSLPTVPTKLFPKLSIGKTPSLPKFDAPKFTVPKVTLPKVDVPKVSKEDLQRLPKVDLPEMKMPRMPVEAPAKAWESLSRSGRRTVVEMRDWLPGTPSTRDSHQRKYFEGLVPNTDALFNAEPQDVVRLTAYQQPSSEPDVPPLPPTPGEGAGNGAPDGPPEEPIGQAPPDNRQVFLRSATVLLNPGDIQFDWGLEYQIFKTDAPVIVQGSILDEEELRDRRLFIPFAARVGLTRRIQAFVQAPVGWAQAERVDSSGETTDETFGIADVSAGANIVLQEGRGQGPDVIGTIGFTAPTGDDPFGNQLTVASLGDGFWGLNGSVLWIHTYDPVVVFYGLGYRHRFERGFNGAMIAPGEEINYNCGVGLAINDRITFSTAFLGQYISETQVNGNSVPGSDLEPITLRLALTAITSPCHIIEPFVRFGLTDDAADADVGVVVTRSF